MPPYSYDLGPGTCWILHQCWSPPAPPPSLLWAERGPSTHREAAARKGPDSTPQSSFLTSLGPCTH